jgi:2-polyprenyl-3-methyl-5-hydroxy-6-metoxy-1,4-benzoquinol methylase
VVATDYDAEAVRFTQLNAQRSGVELAGAQVLDYRTPVDRPAYDLILGSDLLYERRNIAPVAAWIASALRSDGVALISDPNRSAADGFAGELTGRGLTHDVRPVETISPAGLLIRGRIWRIRRGER